MWALLLYYAVLSRVSGELVFYSRWPYYTGAVLAVICSLPGYYLVEKPALAYLQRTTTRKWALPQAVKLAWTTLQLALLKQRLAMRKPPVAPARDWAGAGLEAGPAGLLPQELAYQVG